MLVAFLLTMFANRQVLKNAAAIEHTNKVISNLETIISAVKDAETGFRGFIITHNLDFLDPYFGSRRTADSVFAHTVSLTKNPKQLQRLQALKAHIDEKFTSIEGNLAAIQQNRLSNKLRADSMLATPDAMTSIRAEVSSLQNQEKALLWVKNRRLENTSTAVTSIMIASIIIAFFSVVFGFSSHLKESRERMDAERRVLAYQKELESRIADLALANTALVHMKKQEKFAATGRMARTIAHEIRNPLTNINLATDQLKSEPLAKDENARFLFDVIVRNSERINHLISELLNSTRFADLQYEHFMIDQLIEETINEADDRLQLHDITVSKIFNANQCELFADKAKLKIAFLNIILNAAEAIRQPAGNGRISIETGRDTDKCKVVITDNGVGMDEESLSRLFEPYFTSKPKGNGLGLTNTQNIILNHKGDIEVSSRVNGGTTVTVYLPLRTSKGQTGEIFTHKNS